MRNFAEYPKNIYSGLWKYGHCQGIAVDTEKEFIYYSFTTALVKTDLQGNLIGSCIGGVATGLWGDRIPTLWLHRILGALIIWGGVRYLCR